MSNKEYDPRVDFQINKRSEPFYVDGKKIKIPLVVNILTGKHYLRLGDYLKEIPIPTDNSCDILVIPEFNEDRESLDRECLKAVAKYKR